MKYGSVCSGIEAATVAWHPLGWKPVFFAEIDKFPSYVLQHHYPDVPNAGDFTAIKKESYDAIELLVGGTPCQDFSVAGLRAGMDGKRGQLTVEYAHLAHRLRPRWLVWENVPGVLSIDAGEAFATFLGLLAGVTVRVPEGGWQNSGVIAGAPGSYGLAYRVLDAQHFGVPQRRRRVFVVGYLGDWRRAAAVLFERQSMSGHPAPSRETGQGFTHDLAPSLTSSGRGTERTGESRGQDPVVAVQSSRGDVGYCLNTALFDGPTHSLRADGFDASENGTGRGTPLVPVAYRTSGNCGARETGDKTGALTTSTDPYSHVLAIGLDSQLNGEIEGIGPLTIGSATGSGQPARVAVAMNLRGRDGGAMPELADSASLRSSSGGSSRSYVAGMAVRRLTARECERLQGFPDDYTLIPMSRNVISDKKLDADYVKYMQRTARIRFADGRIVEGEILNREQCRKLAADGPRYKGLGNSMAVPCMRWIGERIEMVEQIVKVAA